jgi:long-chain acyl-CoA synthetase
MTGGRCAASPIAHRRSTPCSARRCAPPRRRRPWSAAIALGLKRGDRLALLLGNDIAFVLALLAGARTGIIIVPLGIRQRPPETRYMLAQSGATALIADATLRELIPDRSDLPGLRHLITVGGTIDGAITFERLIAEAPDPAPPPIAIGEEEDFCILYTSGTTGNPKGARLTHLGVIHSALHYEYGLGLRRSDTAILAVPASHVTGLAAILMTAIRVAGTTVMLDQFRVPEFLAAATAEAMNYTLMVPAIYNLLLLRADLTQHDLSAWRVGAFGGAPMPDVTVERLAALLPALTLQNVYGATETTSPATLLRAGDITLHGDSVGQPLPCADVIVVDDEGQTVPPGTSGEIMIAGPMTIPGYWNNPDANAASFVDGYWRSGDIGTMDEADYVRILDRKKDMINRGGFKIYSVEVENVLAADPSVAECAVIGMPDPVLGERVHAFVFPNGEGASGDALRQRCAGSLSDYKVPDTITLLDAPLPRNANGKVLKQALRARLAPGN